MWIDPMQTTSAESATLRSEVARMTLGGAWATRNCNYLSHAARARQSDYPDIVTDRRGFRLSLTLPCSTSRSVVE
jgi:hypothetical protein